jgi:hypothetical protein
VTARGTALLVFAFAGLAGYLWLGELRPRAHWRGQPAVVAGTPLLRVPPAQVTRVDLEEREARLTALRHDGRWVDPRGQAWQGDAVSDLLDTLAGLPEIMVVDPAPENPADYGLGADAPRLRLLGADGRDVLSLEIGERNPAWTGIYARVAGRREVVLVGAVLHWELEKLHDAAPPS